MKRTFVASVLSLSLAFTSVSAPAQAGEEEIGQLLAGAFALFVIGKAIENASNKKQTKATPPPPRKKPPVWHGYKPVPASCIRHHETQDGKRRILGRKCLEKRYIHFKHLPKKCERKLWTRKGLRKGFAPKCVKAQGFRISKAY